MTEIILHFVTLYRNKNDKSKYFVKRCTLEGVDLPGRMGTIIEVESRGLAGEWELISLSHAFLPLEAKGQLL